MSLLQSKPCQPMRRIIALMIMSGPASNAAAQTIAPSVLEFEAGAA